MPINIKKSHKGLLHKNLGIPEGKPIPASKLAIKSSDSTAVKKRKQFALNAKKFHHAEDGIDITPITKPFQPLSHNVSQEQINNILKKTSPSYQVKPYATDYNANSPLSSVLAATLSTVDALIPSRKPKSNTIRPETSVASPFNGNGSQAIAKKGAKMYTTKSYATEGEKLVTTKRPYNPQDYKPFGENNTIGQDAGWYPAQKSTGPSTGQIRYKNNYGLMGDIVLGEGKGKGSLQLIGNTNGMFNLGIYDENDNEIKPIMHSQPYSEVNKYLTNNYGIVTQRANAVKNGTNKDRNPDEEQLAKNLVTKNMKNGGRMKAKDGLYIEDNQFSQLSPSFLQVEGDTHANGGTDVQFGSSVVEAQKGEPLSMNADGGVTLFGKLTNPLTNRTFESDAKALAKKEMKVTTKYLQPAEELMSTNSPKDKWQSLKFNAGKVMMEGANRKLKQIDESKNHLSDIQSTLLSLKDKGKAELGTDLTGRDSRKTPRAGLSSTLFNQEISPLQMNREFNPVLDEQPLPQSPVQEAANAHPLSLEYMPYNYKAPTNAKPLSFTQILPELYTAATNQVEPVQMQNFTPTLLQPYQVNFDERRNQNASTLRASQQYLGNNPAAQAQIAAQAYEANNNVSAEEFRTNQSIASDVINKNNSLLNEAKLKNLALADNQYVRQSQAKSNTKAQNRTVLQSIVDKMHQNQLEQQIIKLYENRSNYRFNPQTGKAEYYGAPGEQYIDWNLEDSYTSGNNTTPATTTLSKVIQNLDKNNELLNTRTEKKQVLKKKFGGNIPALFKKYH